MDLSSFGTIEPIPTLKLLTKIVDHNRSRLYGSDASGLIECRLVLSSTVEVVGRPIALSRARDAIVATDQSLSYVNLTELAVLELLDLDDAMPLLSDAPRRSTTPQVPASSPPRGDLRGLVEQLNSRMQRRFGLSIEASVIDDAGLGDVGKNQFADFLVMLEESLTTIGDDPIGEIEIGSLEQVGIVQAASGQLAVERSGSVMVIAVPFEEAFKPTMSARLQTELQSKL